MTDAALTQARGTVAQPPDADRSVLCIYCRTDKFVYWPPASRLLSADCPGCRGREPTGRFTALRRRATGPAPPPLPAVFRRADDQ